jgi:hypothetical protein
VALIVASVGYRCICFWENRHEGKQCFAEGSRNWRLLESAIRRAELDPLVAFVLSVLASAFRAFGAIFANTVLAEKITTFAAGGSLESTGLLPNGVTRLFSGLAFCVGSLR